MDDYKIRPVDSSHNAEMIRILGSSPINAGKFTVCFDKSPDIFRISEMKYPESRHLGFFHNDVLKGFASIGYHDALIGGKKEKVCTLYHFYILPEARGRKLSQEAARIFLEEASSKTSLGYFLTLKGNRQVESFIGRNDNEWNPVSRKIGELTVKSIIFSFPRRNRSEYKVRRAEESDIPVIVNLLNNEHRERFLGQPFSTDNFLADAVKKNIAIEDYFVAVNRRGDIKGVCLAWDCSSFRRTRVLQFSKKMYPLLYTYRILEKFLPMAPFPREGECFSELTITSHAVENRDPAIMNALLSEIYHINHNRKYHFMNFGCSSDDAMLNAANGFMQSDVCSNIVLFGFDKQRFNTGTPLPYIDIAFL